MHDERPKETSEAIARFVWRVLGKDNQEGGREEEVSAAVAATVGSG